MIMQPGDTPGAACRSEQIGCGSLDTVQIMSRAGVQGEARNSAVFMATSIAAFGVHAIGHARLLWKQDPLVYQHKATLEYRSALLGDLLLLPLVNVLLDQQLERWDDGLRPSRVRSGRLVGSVAAGAGLTLAAHLYQGAQRLTNWTMPQPWRWNTLGYYHAAYMTTQLTILAYCCGAAATRVRDRGAGALLTYRIVGSSVLGVAFALLLYKDYY